MTLSTLYTIIGIVVPLIGAYFLLNQLFSDSYVIKVELPEFPEFKRKTVYETDAIHLYIDNLTHHSLVTDIEIKLLIKDKIEDQHEETVVLGAKLTYEKEIGFVSKINRKYGLKAPDYKSYNYPFKFSIRVSFRNNKFKVLKLKDYIQTEWAFDPFTKLFSRLK